MLSQAEKFVRPRDGPRPLLDSSPPTLVTKICKGTVRMLVVSKADVRADCSLLGTLVKGLRVANHVFELAMIPLASCMRLHIESQRGNDGLEC